MPPFLKEAELVRDYEPTPKAPATAILLGYPLVRWNDTLRIKQFVEQELWCRDLEMMAPRLWIMTTFSGANINPLHH